MPDLRHDLHSVIEDMIRTWAPDDFWQVAQPLIPVPAPRRQGGGKRRVDDRAVLAAIVYLVQAGCSWWKLPAGLFGVSRATAHRRFTEWTRAGLWERDRPLSGKDQATFHSSAADISSSAPDTRTS
jgi:hypothetical protein